MASDEQRQSNYKWYILILGTITLILVFAIPEACMPVLFSEIVDDLGLNLVQVGTVWGMTCLPGVFAGFLGGMIGDRYGIKRTLSLFCLLCGIVGALRGLSDSFMILTITMFLFGFLTIVCLVNVHKSTRAWFPERQLGMANGILGMGIAFGFTVGAMISATVMSPLLGSWRNVLFLYGGIAIIMSLLWVITGREPGHAGAVGAAGAIPLRQSLSRVSRIGGVWLIAMTGLCCSGQYYGMSGYLPLYLRGAGWSATGADGALAAFSGGSIIGVIPLCVLSDRSGSRKAILFPALFLSMIATGLLSIAHGPSVWPLVIIAGFFRDTLAALLITMTMEVRRVGVAYAATAAGLNIAFARLGGFMSPPLGNSLAGIYPGLPFVFWGGLVFIALLIFLFVEETGRSRDSHRLEYVAESDST